MSPYAIITEIEDRLADGYVSRDQRDEIVGYAEDLADALEKMEKERDTIEEERDALRKQVEALRAESAELNSECNSLVQEVEALRAERDKAVARAQAADDVLEEANASSGRW